MNAQVAKIHPVGMAFQADVALIGNPAQRTLLGKNKGRIVEVNFVNPISIQIQRQVPADAGNLHFVPLAGLPAYAVEWDYRAVNCPRAVQVRELPGIVEQERFPIP